MLEKKKIHLRIVFRNVFRFIFMSVLPSCLYVYLMCLQRSEEGVLFSGAWVTDGCQPPSVCWESNLGPLKKQQVPLSAESSSPKGSFPVRNRLLVSCSKSKFKMLKLKL